ncbi:thiamine phosphate synthase [candidate division KSB1 bacterium]|nr:thiamine phosphate synthase [candidate division KSB1 bacterium]NIR69377.1 thiamine phosphate synthase [candidate division KSB1 bacterium]NIS24195.1 thiamine phosphate synthase [candidate division KSB1 bacterium]NIT71110.1 thiamine phosphate synthase [candidate division KSB1 bacterium]NIU24814.1 thiamine phosphate synthase [candidate division KSB1 bacterium]
MNPRIESRKVDWSLYAILDKDFIKDRSIQYLAEEVIRGGAGIIQLRNKSSHINEFYQDGAAIKEVTAHFGVPLIVNDRLDIALAVDADGVHLGQDDLPHNVARHLIGENKILGISVHNLDEFKRSIDAEPDYLGVGAIYPTNTKDEPQMGMEMVEELRAETELPLVAIGGLTPENLAPVIRAGADGVAVISALLNAEDVRSRAHEFVQSINSARQV